MSLGENIYRLRTAKNMSQGDLADALGVSRQSISKWETDGATPELDKLVKLAGLFGVTLDELVTGKAPEQPEMVAPDQPPQVIIQRQGMPGRKLAGIILLCMAFFALAFFTLIGGFLVGLVFALPFLVCGAICFIAQKHPGLWCAWALFLMVDLYLRWATGTSWTVVFWTFRWAEGRNDARLVIAWCQLLCGLALPVATAARLGKGKLEWTKRNKTLLAVGLALFILCCLPFSTWLFQMGMVSLVTPLAWLQDSLRLALLAAALTAARRSRKQ